MEVFITFPVVAVDGVGSDTGTTATKNIRFLETYGAATAGDIAQFPTAQTALIFEEDVQMASTRSKRLLSSSTPAQIAAVITAANSNVPGLGSAGDATLVAGTVNVTIPGLTTTNKAVLTRHTAGGTVTATVEYFYAVSANTLTITAAVAAGTINTADTSVITYSIVA